MKTTILAFFGLVASAYAATSSVSSSLGSMAEAMGAVSGVAAADVASGVASGSVDGDGSVMGFATVGGAMVGAATSPEPVASPTF